MAAVQAHCPFHGFSEPRAAECAAHAVSAPHVDTMPKPGAADDVCRIGVHRGPCAHKSSEDVKHIRRQ